MNFLDAVGITKPESIKIGPFILNGQIEHKHIDNKSDMMNGVKHTQIDMLDCILVKINGDGWYEHIDDLKLNVLMNGILRSDERDYFSCQKIYPFMSRGVFEYMDEFLLSMFKGDHKDCLFFPFKVHKTDMPSTCHRIKDFDVCLSNIDGIDSIDIFYFGKSILLDNPGYDGSTDQMNNLPYERRASELVIYNTVAKFNTDQLGYTLVPYHACDIITHVLIVVEFESSKMIEFADLYFDNFQIMIADKGLTDVPFKYIFDYYRKALNLNPADFSYGNKLMIPICLEELIGLPYIDIKSTECSCAYITLRITVRPIHELWNSLNDKDRAKFLSYQELLDSYKSYANMKYNAVLLENHIEFCQTPSSHDFVSIEQCSDLYKLHKRRLNKRLSNDTNKPIIYESIWGCYKLIDMCCHDYVLYEDYNEIESDNMLLSVEI